MKQSDTIKRILKLIKPYRLSLLFSFIFAIVSVALTLYAPILTGDAIDLIIGKGNVDFDGITPILIRFAVAIAITALAQWIMNLANNKITYNVVKDIRLKTFEHLQIC